jgi:hypothetical protein
MKRTWVVFAVVLAIAGGLALAPCARAAEQPLLEPVLTKASAGPGEWVNVGLKAVRPGVTITSATVRPRDLPHLIMPLSDSGVMGDKAGDGIWSVSFPVPDDVPPGFYWLDFEAQVTVDGQPQAANASVQAHITKGERRSVQITIPRKGAALSGVVEIAAKVTLPVPMARVVAYVGAASAEMKRAGDVWKATLDTTRAPNGRQRLIVVASAAGTSADAARQQAGALAIASATSSLAEMPVTVRNEYRYCWGDMHAHTLYSDGVQTPADAYRHARDVAKLDFYSVTDHDVQLTLDEYADLRRQADAFDEPGAFAALYGVEWTTDAGHMCFYMCDRFRLSTDLESAYRELGELGVPAHFNHPGANDFSRMRYSPTAAGAMYAAEVRDAKEEACWIAMLNAGWRVGPDGSQDTHDATWGEGPHWTVALARQLTRDGILEALRARRIYSTWDRNMRLELALDGEDMGAAVSRPAGALPLVVNIADPDAGDNIARIEVVADGKTVASVSPAVAAYHWRTRVPLRPGKHYVYVRVTQADGNRAWSSPVWVETHGPRRPASVQP